MRKHSFSFERKEYMALKEKHSEFIYVMRDYKTNFHGVFIKFGNDVNCQRAKVYLFSQANIHSSSPFKFNMQSPKTAFVSTLRQNYKNISHGCDLSKQWWSSQYGCNGENCVNATKKPLMALYFRNSQSEILLSLEIRNGVICSVQRDLNFCQKKVSLSLVLSCAVIKQLNCIIATFP